MNQSTFRRINILYFWFRSMHAATFQQQSYDKRNVSVWLCANQNNELASRLASEHCFPCACVGVFVCACMFVCTAINVCVFIHIEYAWVYCVTSKKGRQTTNTQHTMWIRSNSNSTINPSGAKTFVNTSNERRRRRCHCECVRDSFAYSWLLFLASKAYILPHNRTEE